MRSMVKVHLSFSAIDNGCSKSTKSQKDINLQFFSGGCFLWHYFFFLSSFLFAVFSVFFFIVSQPKSKH